MGKYVLNFILSIGFGSFIQAQEPPSLQAPTQTTSYLLPEDCMDYLKHNDLRSVRDYGNVKGVCDTAQNTSKELLLDLAKNSQKYTGLDYSTPLHLKNGAPDSAYGPIGRKVDLDSGSSKFIVTKSKTQKLKNTILGVTYEFIKNATPSHHAEPLDVYEAQLLLFVHSDAEGYFFKKVDVKVDFENKVETSPNIVVTRHYEILPLDETDFEVYVALATQTAYLIDRGPHQIKRVFPITAGGMDVRLGIDGLVESMTLQVPKGLWNRASNSPEMRKEYQPFHLEHSTLVKQDVWSHSTWNTSSRTTPHYYKGRPFLAIIDQRYVTHKKDGSLNYGDGYRQIAFHYKIKSELKRGFHSHGCLRTDDNDLYVLAAILNHGPKDFIPTSVHYFQPEFEHIDSVMKRITGEYKKVIYSKLKSPNSVNCPGKGTYVVRRYGDKGYHTVADSDCLTKMNMVRGRTLERDSKGHATKRKNIVENILNHLKGLPSDLTTLYAHNAQHIPLVLAEKAREEAEKEAHKAKAARLKAQEEALKKAAEPSSLQESPKSFQSPEAPKTHRENPDR